MSGEEAFSFTDWGADYSNTDIGFGWKYSVGTPGAIGQTFMRKRDLTEGVVVFQRASIRKTYTVKL